VAQRVLNDCRCDFIRRCSLPTPSTEVTMSSTEKSQATDSGTPVEVRSRFDQAWVTGFEVAERVAEPGPGYRIRRRSDRSILPVVFAPEDVRMERSRGLW